MRRARRLTVDQLHTYVDKLEESARFGIKTTDLKLINAAITALSHALTVRFGSALEPYERRVRCLLSEYHEYFGRYGDADAVLAPYVDAFSRDQTTGELAHPRLCLWLANVFFRRRQFDDAEQLMMRSIHLYEDQGDRYGAAFAKLFASRVMARQQPARVVHALLRDSYAGFDEALGTASHYRKGICEVLSAWVAYWDDDETNAIGALSRAVENFAHAGVDDPVHFGRIAFIRGCLARASAIGPGEFGLALEHFAESVAQFQKADHLPYRAGSLNQLALTRLQRGATGDFAQADSILRLAAKVSEQDYRTRVENRYFMARLRIRQERVSDAEAELDELLRQFETAPDSTLRSLRSLRAEVLVAKARALLLRRRVLTDPGDLRRIDDDILKHVQDARTLIVGRRRRIEVACWLVQAELECRRYPDPSYAQASLERARQTMQPMNHRMLSAWADEIRSEIEFVEGNFRLGLLQRPQTYAANHELLKIWLVWAALQRATIRKDGSASRADVAMLVGIKRQVLEKWLSKWRVSTPSVVGAAGMLGQIQEALRSRKGAAATQEP